MATPVFTLQDITNTSIKFTWLPLSGTASGGSAVTIVNYEISWDQGTGSWVSLSSTVDPSATSYTHTGLTPNKTYQHKIRAINLYGPAVAYSASISVLTAQPPDTPDPPETSIHDIYVKIIWTPPFDNYATISSYTVFIEDSSS